MHPASAHHFFTTAHPLVIVLGILTAVVCSFILVGNIEDNNSHEHKGVNKPGLHVIRESIGGSPLRMAASILGTIAKDIK